MTFGGPGGRLLECAAVQNEHVIRAAASIADDEEIIIPNATIVQSTVKNYTLKDSIFRLRAKVGVTYGSDMALVKETLREVGASMEWRNRTKDPLVLMIDFGDSAVIFEVSVWIDNPWVQRRALSDLNEAIWWAFKEKGIVIAFPQLDVHLDREAVEAGMLDLDVDVNDALRSWQVPENEHTGTHKVTLRRLLSHTAGLTVFGYRGYPAGEKLPTLQQVLDGINQLRGMHGLPPSEKK